MAASRTSDMNEIRRQAIQEVIEQRGAENLKNPVIGDEFTIPQGTVFRVDFIESSSDEAVYVYVFHDNGDYRIFQRSQFLVQFIARSPQPQNVLNRILQITGVAGLIALIITFTICGLAIQSREIPDILANALTVILGFYFATTIYESAKRQHAS